MTDAPNDAQQLYDAVIQLLGSMPVERALPILANFSGQLLAHQARGAPGQVPGLVEQFAKNTTVSAMKKLAHDDNMRRQREQGRGSQ